MSIASEVLMTAGKAAGLALGFAGAVALGIAIGATVKRGALQSDGDSPAPVESARRAPETTAPVEPAAPRAGARRAAAASTSAAAVAGPAASISVSEPRLHERLKPVMKRGTRMTLAAEGFRTAEEFATVAHAAHNTQVPFVLLKHRVLNEGRLLADAIHEARPDIPVAAEPRTDSTLENQGPVRDSARGAAHTVVGARRISFR